MDKLIIFIFSSDFFTKTCKKNIYYFHTNSITQSYFCTDFLNFFISEVNITKDLN